MAEEVETKKPNRAMQQLKELRANRTESKELIEIKREQTRIQKAVLQALGESEKTVPEIAEETGIESQQVFWMITALRKYNKVENAKKRGDYMAYRRKQ